jgi:hypothetical protein
VAATVPVLLYLYLLLFRLHSTISALEYMDQLLEDNSSVSKVIADSDATVYFSRVCKETIGAYR